MSHFIIPYAFISWYFSLKNFPHCPSGHPVERTLLKLQPTSLWPTFGFTIDPKACTPQLPTSLCSSGRSMTVAKNLTCGGLVSTTYVGPLDLKGCGADGNHMDCGVGWLFFTWRNKITNSGQPVEPSTGRVPTWQHLKRLPSPAAGGKSMLKIRAIRGRLTKGTRVLLEELLAENFLKLMKDMNPHIQET